MKYYLPKFSIFVLSIIIANTCYAKEVLKESQQCVDEFVFVVNYIENNLPGFYFHVTSKTDKDYSLFKEQLFETAQKTNNKTLCYKVLVKYVEHFKDNHTKISMEYENVDDSNQESINNFFLSDAYQATGYHQLKQKDYKQYPIDDIRGLYQTANGAYKVVIIESQSASHDYIGVVVESQTPLWKKGQIKIEIKSKEHGAYQALVSMKNHHVQFYNHFPLHDGILGDGWYKTTVKNKTNPALNLKTELELKQINSNIVYLRIPSFSGYQTADLQAYYAMADPMIRQSENLIIDVRDNGGGSDSNALPLVKYLYSNPIQGDNVSLYVTKDNIKAWENRLKQFKSDKENYSAETIKGIEELIETMKVAKNKTFLNISQGDTLQLDQVLEKPKRIVIMQNRNCASTCESLLFWGMQSKKTILVGEHSGGYVGYGEIQQMKTPNYGFDFQSSMSLYESQRKYEAIGVPPNVLFDYKRDWVEQAQEVLNKGF